jgi:hypothetical protein
LALRKADDRGWTGSTEGKQSLKPEFDSGQDNVEEANMLRYREMGAIVGLICALGGTAQAQSVTASPMNEPDQVAWQLFATVNADASGGNALFETWASDSDTFVPNPQFPATPTPLALHAPIVPTLGMLAIQKGGGLVPAAPPSPMPKALGKKPAATRRHSTLLSQTICTKYPVFGHTSVRRSHFLSSR